MAVAEHLVASTRYLRQLLLKPQDAMWLWNHLRKAFPDALCCVFMPDHIHLLLPMGHPGGCQRFRRVLNAFTARSHIQFDVCVQRSNSIAIARRTVCYVFNNPVHAHLVNDAWTWLWSTLRDLGGAAYPIWTPPERVARFLQLSPKSLLRVSTSTSQLQPVPPVRAQVGFANPDAVVSAIAAAFRIPRQSVWETRRGRRLLVQACAHVGTTSPKQLSETLELPERSVNRYMKSRDQALAAVLLCLSDERLRSPCPELRQSGRAK